MSLVRYRVAAGGAVVFVLAALAIPSDAAGSHTRWNLPVLISSTQAARETSIALDPTNPSRAFVCDPSGVPDTQDGQSYFFTTSNGGKKWDYESVETSSSDSRRAAFEGGDCDVAYDSAGTMYSADTWLGDLSVGHSTDHGQSWSGTSLAGSSPIVDRPWLVGGKPGELFVAYQDLQCCLPAAMWFMKSTDYGQTFTQAVSVVGPTTDALYTWEGNFVVSPGGQDIYLVYSRRSSAGVRVNVDIPGLPMAKQETIWVTHSADGGKTWTPRLVATLPTETSTIYPSIGLDTGGTLHVAWSAPSRIGNPISYTWSTDDGDTWVPAVPLNPGKVGWAPWVVSGGKPGQAAVVWLGSDDPKASSARKSSWFFSFAKVDSRRANPVVEVANTTRTRMYRGLQVEPEFEMAHFDKRGKLHLGMSVYKTAKKGQSDHWAVYSQTER